MELILLITILISVWVLGGAVASLNRRMGCVVRALRALEQAEVFMAGEMDTLAAEIERNTSVDESAKLLLARLASKIQELINAGDPAKLQAFITSLKGSTDQLAEAVVANTPAEDPVP